MVVLGSTKCWQWWHRPQLGQLCIPKPVKDLGPLGGVRPVTPGDRTHVGLYLFHLESLGSCSQLHFTTGVHFSHYSSSESLSFPAVHVVSKASLHCAHPCSPLLHISCPSAFPALLLPSPSNNKLKLPPWPMLCAVRGLPAAFSPYLQGTCCAGALASAV